MQFEKNLFYGRAKMTFVPFILDEGQISELCKKIFLKVASLRDDMTAAIKHDRLVMAVFQWLLVPRVFWPCRMHSGVVPAVASKAFPSGHWSFSLSTVSPFGKTNK